MVYKVCQRACCCKRKGSRYGTFSLKSLDIHVSFYDYELTDLRITISEFSESLKWNLIRASILDDDLSTITFRNGERRLRIDEFQVEISRAKDDVIIWKQHNMIVVKQRNIFCQIAHRLYNNISQLYLIYEIAKEKHRKMCPFLEFKDEEIDVECYNCGSLVSSDESLSD